MKLKKFLLLAGAYCAGAAMLSDCNGGMGSNTVGASSLQSGSTPEQIQQAKQRIINSRNLKGDLLTSEPNIALANGFDSRTGWSTETSACLAGGDDPSKITIANPHAQIDFSNTISSDTVANLLHTSVSGKVNMGVFSASVSAKYARDSQENRQKITFNYLQSIGADATFKTNGLGKNILSDDAKILLEGGNDVFTEVCGDSFISSAKVGAVLLTDVSIEFANASFKEKFDGSAKGKILGIGSISGEFSQFNKENHSSAIMTIRVAQLGGDSTKLARIFGKPEPDGHGYNWYNPVLCNESNILSCQKIINEVIGYAQNEFEPGVNFKDMSTLYMFDYNSKLYSKLGVTAQLPILTESENAAREYLTDTITQDRRMLQYLQAYQRQDFYNTMLDYVTRDMIQKAITDYQKMINEYNNYQILDSCYGDTANINTRCIYAANQVKQMHDKYNESIYHANRLSETIVVNGFGGIKLVPLVANWGKCTATVCATPFVAYDASKQSFLKYLCQIDTTPDSSYFKLSNPTQTNKTMVCIDLGAGLDNYYIRKVNGYNINETGRLGRFINGQEQDSPSDSRGINAWYYYSDSSDFKYNPI